MYLLQFLLEAVRGIAEALEYTADRRYVVVIFLHTLLIVFCALAIFLFRICRHEELVGISSYGEAVVFVDRHHERCTKTKVGRDKL